jgi:hypothetical protein
VTPGGLSRYAALAVGGFQLLANGAVLIRGLLRLPDELAKEGATLRLADLLRTAWVYGTLGNLCVSLVLLLVSSGLRAGEPLARHVASAIGVYYLVLGPVTYWFGQGRHAGMLVFSALGLALLGTLWFSR